jgi:tetraacyldisaccharide 4'-kinase
MLRPLGWLYGRIIDLRNLFYDKGWFKTFDLGARTISIGNITTGGTGKTPLVTYVAELLAANGEKVSVLTRGYGRQDPSQRVLVSDFERVLVDARTGGDEPVEVAEKLQGKAIVVADADRVVAAEWARDQFGITTFVLDDAFQHRRAKRDLDIVCIDATDPFGNGSILPAGPLREPLKNLKRADLVVITRANLVDDTSNIKSEISKWAPGASIFEGSGKIVGLAEFGARAAVVRNEEEENPRRKKFLAFCGLGNPSNFFRQLGSDGFEVVVKKPFPDHHYYTQDEIRKLENLARSAGADALATTAKDAVELRESKFELPCFVVETELVFDDPDGFRRLITSS